MVARRLADVVVAVHLAYLAFIPLGGWLVRRWSRLLPIHLGAVAAGLASITVGFECPLTAWEQRLRRLGGEHVYGGGFIDHYLTGRLFPHGYDRAVQLALGLALLLPYLQRSLHRGRSPGDVPPSTAQITEDRPKGR